MDRPLAVSMISLVLLSGMVIPAFAIDTGGGVGPPDVLPATNVGAGLGTLDYIFFQSSGGGGTTSNDDGATFNGDNSNTDLPSGGQATSFDESFVTSIGEIRDFYNLQFGTNIVPEIVLFFDAGENDNLLDVNEVDIISQYTTPSGTPFDDPENNDVTSAQQNSIDDTCSGGTVEATLTAPIDDITVIGGSGFTNFMVLTGIDPYDGAFSDSDRLCFNVALGDLGGTGETIFLSGSFHPGIDLVGGVLTPIDTTGLVLAGAHTTVSWLIPVIISVVGIGFVLARTKF